MKKIIIPERLPSSINGLRDMINFLTNKYDTKNMTIIEIGSWTGLSAIEFSKVFGKVICVDTWAPTIGINTQYDMKEVERIFDSRTKNIANIEKRKGKSEDIGKEAGKAGEKFDIIYIDGAHDYNNVKLDLLLWKKMITKCITGHDYYSKFPGVIRAVNEAVGKPSKIFRDSSWIKEL